MFSNSHGLNRVLSPDVIHAIHEMSHQQEFLQKFGNSRHQNQVNVYFYAL